jgi:phage protein D
MKAKRQYIEILYNSRDITNDVSAFLERFTYTDNASGKADEISLVFNDSDGLWASEWYPDKGDNLAVKFGYENKIVDAGVFVIDEISSSGFPRKLDLRAISASANKALRTKNSKVSENKTLRQLVEAIAEANSLTVLGEISDIPISRTTQNKETDLAFLQRIGKEFGYVFNVKNDTLVFTLVYNLENQNAVETVDLINCSNYSFTDKLVETYKNAQSRYTNPQTGETAKATSKTNEGATAGTASDVLIISTKAENKQQAEAKAKAAAYFANTLGQTGRLSLEGNPVLVAGNNIQLTSFGALDGKFQILTSTHTIERTGGYKTSIEVKRVSL